MRLEQQPGPLYGALNRFGAPQTRTLPSQDDDHLAQPLRRASTRRIAHKGSPLEVQ